MKRIAIFLMVCLLPILAMAYDFAYEHQQDDEKVTLYYQINSDGETVTLARPPQAYQYNEVIIPSSVSYDGKTYTVTAIGSEAFSGSTVNRVKMANTITEIYKNAFYPAPGSSSSALNEIEFSTALKKIGDYAFYRTNLRVLDFPDGLEYIGEGAFYEVNEFEIHLPESLKYIGPSAFYGNRCHELYIPGSIGVIYDGAFAGNTSAHSIDKVSIGEGISSIGNSAFGFSQTKEVSLPSTLTTIGDYAFSECLLSGKLEIPEGVVSIGYKAFWRNYPLHEIILPSTLKSLGDSAFEECRSAESINFPSSLKCIPGLVCSGMTMLSKVEIEEGVKEIQAHAFFNCVSLARIILPSSIEKLGEALFYNTGLVSFDFPVNLHEMPQRMFGACENLKSIVIPDWISQVGDYAFIECSTLENVTIPKNLKTLGKGLFSGCSSLQTVALPESLTNIPSEFFYECKLLNAIEIPNTVTEIGDGAFENCVSLEHIELPSTITKIGDTAFKGCSRLRSLYLPTSLESIGFEVFVSCQALESVYAPIAEPLPARHPVIYRPNATTLYVPIGTKSYYEDSFIWNEFYAIEEMDMENIEYQLSFMVTSGIGSILVNDEPVNNYSVGAMKGEKVMITFEPEAGWSVGKVVLNGEDITNEIRDNSYEIAAVERNYAFEVNFKEGPIDIDIYSGVNGVITIKEEYGDTLTLAIKGNTDWEVSSVHLNGNDVTADVKETGLLVIPNIRTSQEIYISYEETAQGSVESAGQISQIKVYGQRGGIVIEGLEMGKPYSIFTADGIRVASGESFGQTLYLSLPDNDIYLGKTPTKTVKIAL